MANTHPSIENQPERQPDLGWNDTYRVLMEHIAAPCLGDPEVQLRYVHEMERIIEQARAVTEQNPDTPEASEAHSIIDKWSVDGHLFLRMPLIMLEDKMRMLVAAGAVDSPQHHLRAEIDRLKTQYGL